MFKKMTDYVQSKRVLQIIQILNAFESENPLESAITAHTILSVCMAFANFLSHAHNSVESL